MGYAFILSLPLRKSIYCSPKEFSKTLRQYSLTRGYLVVE